MVQNAVSTVPGVGKVNVSVVWDPALGPEPDVGRSARRPQHVVVLASLTPREERIVRMRFGLGMNNDHTLADARANSADRGQGTAEAQAPKPIKGAQELSR